MGDDEATGYVRRVWLWWPRRIWTFGPRPDWPTLESWQCAGWAWWGPARVFRTIYGEEMIEVGVGPLESEL